MEILTSPRRYLPWLGLMLLAAVSPLRAQVAAAQKADPAARAYALADAGYKLYDAGQYAEAAQDFEQALQLEPQNYPIAAQLGYAYLHLNEPERAKTEFTLAAHSSDAHLRAFRLVAQSLLTGNHIRWGKTQHHYPGAAEEGTL